MNTTPEPVTVPVPDDPTTRARQLLDAATPGPWKQSQPGSRFIVCGATVQIDEADWGQPADGKHGGDTYQIGLLCDGRAWRYADAEFIAAAPELVAGLLAENDRLRARVTPPATDYRPHERLYGQQGDEVLSCDIDEFVQEWVDRWDGDLSSVEFAEFSVHPTRDHLPSADHLLELVHEWAAVHGMVAEDFEVGGGASDTAAAETFLNAVASNVTYSMADRVVAMHTIEVRDGQPYLDGEPWGEPLDNESDFAAPSGLGDTTDTER